MKYGNGRYKTNSPLPEYGSCDPCRVAAEMCRWGGAKAYGMVQNGIFLPVLLPVLFKDTRHAGALVSFLYSWLHSEKLPDGLRTLVPELMRRHPQHLRPLVPILMQRYPELLPSFQPPCTPGLQLPSTYSASSSPPSHPHLMHSAANSRPFALPLHPASLPITPAFASMAP